MKHAYLIIAHNRPELLQHLVEMLDDVRNDIFIHIDKKSDITEFDCVKAYKSHLFFTKERVNVVWADYSQIESELTLFREASQHDVYQYYHLISGIDIPIKSQSYIHDFFDCHMGKEFVGYLSGKDNERLLRRRTDLYHVCTKYGRSRLGIVLSQVRRVFCVLQRIVGYKRKHNVDMKIGPNWVSITDNLCRWIVDNATPTMMNNFRYTSCGDELFVQTMLWNSPFRKNIYQYNDDSFEGCLRLIDWQRGNPYIFQFTDMFDILTSNRLFCRKIVDVNLAKEIHKRINENSFNYLNVANMKNDDIS